MLLLLFENMENINLLHKKMSLPTRGAFFLPGICKFSFSITFICPVLTLLEVDKSSTLQNHWTCPAVIFGKTGFWLWDCIPWQYLNIMYFDKWNYVQYVPQSIFICPCSVEIAAMGPSFSVPGYAYPMEFLCRVVCVCFMEMAMVAMTVTYIKWPASPAV